MSVITTGTPIEMEATTSSKNGTMEWFDSWAFTGILLVIGVLISVLQLPTWVAACFIFILAGLNVIANDSIQTLGTCLASMRSFLGDRTWLWAGLWFGGWMVATHLYSFYMHEGDLSFGKLSSYPEPKRFTTLMVLAPILLRAFTKCSVPVSTTFLMLSLYSTTTFELENAQNMSFFQQMYAFFTGSEQITKLTTKSFWGYLVSFGAPIVCIWLPLLLFGWIKKSNKLTKDEANSRWGYAIIELFASTFLWVNWLMHDTANITVMFPRQFSLLGTIGIVGTLCAFLFLILKQGGGPIQKVILEKSGTSDIRSAIAIDFCFGLLLLLNNTTPIPMSTTFIFVGLLGGRELLYGIFDPDANSFGESFRSARENQRFVKALRRIGIDVLRLTFGVILSMGLVYLDFVLNS